MKVFVTGGSGFLGSAVIRALLHKGHTVVATVRASSNRKHLENLPGVEVVVAPLDHEGRLREAMDGCDGLCHVAGAAGRFYAARQEYERSNVEASRNVFRAARNTGVRRAVYTGTIAITSGLQNAYSDSKLRGLQQARRVAGSKMEILVVHPSGMIGPQDRKPTPMGRAIALFAAGGLPAVVGGGSGYIHVDDAAAAHVAALGHGDPQRHYILNAEYWRTSALFAYLAQTLKRGRPLVVPATVAHGLATVAEPLWRMRSNNPPPVNLFVTSYLRLPAYAFGDGQEDREALGLDSYRTVKAALSEAVAWFRANGLDKDTLARS